MFKLVIISSRHDFEDRVEIFFPESGLAENAADALRHGVCNDLVDLWIVDVQADVILTAYKIHSLG